MVRPASSARTTRSVPRGFKNAATRRPLSEAARELVTIADTIVEDGQATRWTGIVESELACARQVQADAVGLKLREIEQAVMATFLHSQPKGRSAKARDLMLLVGPCRPDKIEFEKGLVRWSQTSSWLDDEHKPEKENQVRAEWRLGNRPNLQQMHSAAAVQIQPDVVKARLIEEIGKLKTLTSGASASGVRVHTLPTKPKDIEDDGLFHYAVLIPSAASESGKPSPDARRFLDETTGPDKPRVFRNAVLLLAASKDGLSAAEARVRDHMAWERVLDDLTPKNDEERQQKGSVDVARLQTLKLNIDKAKAKVPEAVWLLSGPASLLAEPIPTGLLTLAAKLRVPPATISAAAILRETLPAAWKDSSKTALAIATALSQQAGHTLPWKTVRDVIGGSLQARFIALEEGSAPWPCEMPAANSVKLKVAETGGEARMVALAVVSLLVRALGPERKRSSHTRRWNHPKFKIPAT